MAKLDAIIKVKLVGIGGPIRLKILSYVARLLGLKICVVLDAKKNE